MEMFVKTFTPPKERESSDTEASRARFSLFGNEFMALA
jgi:hypothetical protein